MVALLSWWLYDTSWYTEITICFSFNSVHSASSNSNNEMSKLFRMKCIQYFKRKERKPAWNLLNAHEYIYTYIPITIYYWIHIWSILLSQLNSSLHLPPPLNFSCLFAFCAYLMPSVIEMNPSAQFRRVSLHPMEVIKGWKWEKQTSRL